MSVAFRFAAAFLLLGLSGPAAAQPPEPPPAGRYCDEHPIDCEEMRQRYTKYCQSYPETCAAAEERRQEHRAFCAKNPDRCPDLADAERQRDDQMRDFCQANPHECANEEAYQRAERRRREFCRQNKGECEALVPQWRTGPPR
jgi:hypothetical protein